MPIVKLPYSRPTLTFEELRQLEDICSRIGREDNACTAEPIFLVQAKRRRYGLDPQWLGLNQIAWVRLDGDSSAVVGLEASQLEERYQSTGEETDGFIRTGFVDDWEYIQPFLTRHGAEQFIARHGHRYHPSELRVYVDSGHSNPEWKLLRKTLRSSKP